MLSCAPGVLAGSSVGVKVGVSSTHAWLGQYLAGLPHQHVSRCNIASGLSVHLVKRFIRWGVDINFGAETILALPFSLSTS